MKKIVCGVPNVIKKVASCCKNECIIFKRPWLYRLNVLICVVFSGLQVLGRRTVTHADKKELPYIEATIMEIQRNSVLRKKYLKLKKNYNSNLSSTSNVRETSISSFYLYVVLFRYINIHNTIFNISLYFFSDIYLLLLSRFLMFFFLFS